MIQENGSLPNNELIDLLKTAMWRKGWTNKVFLIDGHPKQEQWEGFKTKLIHDVNLICTLYYELDNATIKFKAMKTTDYEKLLKKKINTFMNDTLQIINEAKKTQNVVTIDASKTKEEVFEQSCTVIDTLLNVKAGGKKKSKRSKSIKRAKSPSKITTKKGTGSTVKLSVDTKSTKKPIKSAVKDASKAKSVKSKAAKKSSPNINDSVATECFSPIKISAFDSKNYRSNDEESYYSWNTHTRKETEIFQIDQWLGPNSAKQNQKFEDDFSSFTVTVTFTE